ncbi:hypothetical protein G6027_06305 [Dietzia sp. SLG310A2-38A2]|uniref:hypothetical protein n=1 Tax=Dietzia sp. SLG310A2-38A2 TaxID=1630643 RepID=UPI0015F86F7C|nr:hypothetical protein [Dietzia sp. SLG310A2-38A2]MBB1030499.1 hypothetical protein [Dietzia sp. SLG310A2-38A2]
MMKLTDEQWEALASSVGLGTDSTAAEVIAEVRGLVGRAEELTGKLGEIAEALVSTPSGALPTSDAERLSWV